MEIKAIVDYSASAPVVGPKIGKRLCVWNHKNHVSILQRAGTKMEGGKFVINTSFSIPSIYKYTGPTKYTKPTKPTESTEPTKYTIPTLPTKPTELLCKFL